MRIGAYLAAVSLLAAIASDICAGATHRLPKNEFCRSETTASTGKQDDRFVRVIINFARADRMAVSLEKEIQSGRLRGVQLVRAVPGNNSILVYGDDESIREAIEFIRFQDVKPVAIRIRVDAMAVTRGATGRLERSISTATGQTLSSDPLSLESNLSGSTPAAAQYGRSGLVALRVTPWVNGDYSITVEYAGHADSSNGTITLRRKFAGSCNVPNGGTVAVAASAHATGSVNGSVPGLQVYLTAEVVTVDRMPSITSEVMIVSDLGSTARPVPEKLLKDTTETIMQSLAHSYRFEILKREEVMRHAEELGFKPPFSPRQLKELAVELGATLVAEGDMTVVTGPRTTCEIDLRIWDARSEETVYAARETGELVTPTASREETDPAERAATSASFKVANSIIKATRPFALILNDSGERAAGATPILINRGRSNGYGAGMELSVTRDGGSLGVLRINRLADLTSECSVVRQSAPLGVLYTARPIVSPKAP